MRPIVDAHLDLAWNASAFDRDLELTLEQMCDAERGMDDVNPRGRATTCFPEMQKGKISLCLGTILARSGPQTPRQNAYRRTDLDFPHRIACHAAAYGQLACYRLWERSGSIRWIDSASKLDAHWESVQSGEANPLGVILSMEGADPILDADSLQQWYDAGLRAIGPAHYGHSHYSAGTGTEGGLSEQGRWLLGEMAKLGIALDVTHLADQAMAEAFDLFEGVCWASHHNVRSLVPGQRQLSDEQIRGVLQRDGVIGAALDAWMLYPNWEKGVTNPEVVGIEAVANHIDYICQMAGTAKHCGIGSDLDGGYGTEQTPRDLKTIADLQRLDEILQNRGYSSDDIDGIFYGNWLRIFRRLLAS